MRIDDYGFGYIVIDGKRYTSDVIIYRDRVYDGWWRKEGHRLHFSDLEDVIREKPEILIIGTGRFGVMKVPDEVVRRLEEMGIKVIVLKTKEACKKYNELKDKHYVVAALHLTC